MSKRFIDRTVIVTGAVGALGETLVKDFASEGANIVIGAGMAVLVTSAWKMKTAPGSVNAKTVIVSSEGKKSPLAEATSPSASMPILCFAVVPLPIVYIVARWEFHIVLFALPMHYNRKFC